MSFIKHNITYIVFYLRLYPNVNLNIICIANIFDLGNRYRINNQISVIKIKNRFQFQQY